MPYKGGKRSRATLKYDRDWYLPHIAKANMPEHEKQIREEYSRLRSIARKRLERIQGTEWETSDIYRQNVGKFKPLSQIKPTELPGYLDAVSRFVLAQRSSIKGLESYRKASVENLQKQGFSFVNEKNYNEVVRFLESTRISNLNRLFDSYRQAEWFAETKEKGLKMNTEEFKAAYKKFIRQEVREQRKRGVSISAKTLKGMLKNVDELF